MPEMPAPMIRTSRSVVMPKMVTARLWSGHGLSAQNDWSCLGVASSLMQMRWEPLRGDAADLVQTTARAVLERPGDFLATADAAVLAGSPLTAYPELAAQAQASTHANIIRWLTSN